MTDREAQDCITQKFEGLVVNLLEVGVFMSEGTMNKGLLKRLKVLKTVVQNSLQLIQMACLTHVLLLP
jgi:hypothetical protein